MTHKETKPAAKGRKTLLSPEVQGLIVHALETGAFEIGAAQAAGISERTFHNWMERGAKARDEEDPYALFVAAVNTAKATARVTAETLVFQTDPFRWLRYGPGRERPGQPGWGENVEISGPAGGDIPLHITTVWGRAERTAAAASRKVPPKPALPENVTQETPEEEEVDESDE